MKNEKKIRRMKKKDVQNEKGVNRTSSEKEVFSEMAESIKTF